MQPQDYPVNHFSDMLRLATELKSEPAQLLEHLYSYDAFGSWYVVVRREGVPVRISFEGGSTLMLSRSSERKRPFSWIDERSIPINEDSDVIACVLRLLDVVGVQEP